MKKTTLKASLFKRFAVILATIVALVCMIAFSMLNILSAQEEIDTLSQQELSLSSAISAHHSWSGDMLKHITFGNSFTGSLSYTGCGFGVFLYSDAIQNDPDYTSFIAEVEQVHMDIHSAGQLIIDSNSYDEKVAIYNEEVSPNVDELVQKLNTQLTASEQLRIEEEQTMYATIVVTFISCVIAVALVIVACITLFNHLIKEVVQPLVAIDVESGKLERGDLKLDFTTSSKIADIDNLSKSLNFSVSELKRMIDEISANMVELSNRNFSVYPSMSFPGEFENIEVAMSKVIDQIRLTMNEIKDSAGLVSSESRRFSSVAQELANGSIDQASGVEELASTVTVIMEKVSENAENAENANDLGSSVTEIMEESTRCMNELLEAISEIRSSSTGIEKIIKTIDDIAFQTNILALNAAVESSRAGQAGKGFAVVADEVRNLAQKSIDAANSTAVLIQTSLDSVERGELLAGRTNESFAKVAESSQKVLDLISNIADASRDQSEGIKQISIGLNQISSVVQQNSATSEESAATSEELSAQATTLNDLVEGFRL